MKTNIKFKDYAQQIAETISTVLECDITIIDKSFYRIAGTGDFYSERGKKLDRNNNFYTVIKEKKKCLITTKKLEKVYPNYYTIDNPTMDEEVSILIPIIVKGEAMAAIGLSALEARKMEQILSEYGKYSRFMEKMSELLATQLWNSLIEREVDLLKSNMNGIIDTFPDGIICIDIDRKVTFVNSAAQVLLGRSEVDILHKIYAEAFECVEIERAMDKRIDVDDLYCVFSCEKGQLSVIASTRVVRNEGAAIGTVVLFQETNKIKKSYDAIPSDVKFTLNHIMGASIEIETTKKIIKTVAKSASTVLLRGESGTGKELCAKAIHSESTRKNEPFVAVNCGAIPETLLESELFGYEAGAFTGASKTGKKGKFELAQNGTLFLDEIGDMPYSLQVKLLRVLQEKTVTRIGGAKPIKLNVRFITATNKNLPEMVKSKQFREDLYYRINVIPIKIPPLRDRGNDVVLLARHFLNKYAGYLNKSIEGFSDEVLKTLVRHSWPGNIRELENVIEFCVNMETGNVIDSGNLPDSLKQESCKDNVEAEKGISIERDENTGDIRVLTEEFEKEKIVKLLSVYGSTTKGKKQIAEKLNIGIATLYRKIKKYGI